MNTITLLRTYFCHLNEILYVSFDQNLGIQSTGNQNSTDCSLIPHVDKIMNLSFHAWRFSPTIIFSRFLYNVTNDRISFFFKGERFFHCIFSPILGITTRTSEVSYTPNPFYFILSYLMLSYFISLYFILLWDTILLNCLD